jgi:hypothetical protein
MKIALRRLDGVRSDLERTGFGLVPGFLDRRTSTALRELYPNDKLFRSRIVMQRHAFGHGEYKYFAHPLPETIETLREELYREIVPVANAWMRALGMQTFPASHQQFLDACFEAGQRRPTALLLRYQAGDYNCLHQDLYGPVAFPFQATIYLSRPEDEFRGGEVVLTEQKPRAQTRAHVLAPNQGDLLILPTRIVPRHGVNGIYRVTFRHGVSTVTWGERYTLGIIFHDAL